MGIHNYEGTENIFYLDTFADELVKLKRLNPNYGKWLQKKLEILDQGASKATDGVLFEKLNDCDLYSIRHVSKFNERIIYYIIDENDGVLLLAAFCERRTSDYRNNIKKAKDRLKQLHKEI